MVDGRMVFIFEKSLTGEGISVITIFNKYRKPVCERLIFKPPLNRQTLTLETDKRNYQPRSPIKINIKGTGNIIDRDTLDLSISVHREDAVSSGNPTMGTYFLLSSDLKGYIEDPEYYFKQNTNEAADNLMLTNGWRRFKWEDIFQNDKVYFKYAPEYNGAIISGTVKDTITNRPAAGVEMYNASVGFQNAFSTSVVDTNGNVAFEMKKLYGAHDLIFQTKDVSDSQYKFSLLNPFSSVFVDGDTSPFIFSPALIKELHDLSISMQVQNIYSSRNLRKFNTVISDTIPFYTNYDASYKLDNYTRYATLEEILREYVVLVDVRKREGNFHFSLFDFADSKMMKTDPLVLLDGVPIKDFNKFMQIDPLKLYKLEVINRKYFYGTSVFNGILSWTSYSKNLADYDMSGVIVIDYDGLQQEREFYAPQYDNEEKVYSHLPDYRNVLLWVPIIKLLSSASKEITFYTSDLPGKYIAEIQGISNSGKAVYFIQHFTISNK